MHSSTRPKSYCFVLMPFDKGFDDIYEYGIKGACADADVYCERVDEQIFLGSMLDRIYNQISRADILVADMTGRNANVFYEVGYAHALGKPVVLLTQRAEDIPFDLKHFPHIVYGAQIKELRAQLSRRIEYLRAAGNSSSPTPLALELFLGQESLALGGVVQKYAQLHVPGSRLALFNGTQVTYGPGDFQIAVIAPTPYELNRVSGASVTALPDGRYLHMLPVNETLFPGAYTTVSFYLDSYSNRDKPQDFDVILRVFSAAGFRDFSLRFEQLAAVDG